MVEALHGHSCCIAPSLSNREKRGVRIPGSWPGWFSPCSSLSLRFLLLLLFSFLLHPLLHAQESSPRTFEFGPAASYAIGLQSGLFPVYRGFPDCGLFSDGRASALRLGGIAQWPMLLGEWLGLAAGVGWSDTRSRYRAYPLDEQRLIDPETRQLIDIDRQFWYDTRATTITLDLLARYALAERWAITLGPTIGYRFAATFEQTDNVVDPPERSFADGEKVHPMELGALFTMRPLVLGAMIAGSYRIPLSRHVTLAPELALRGDILSQVREGNWRSLSIGAGFAVLYAPPEPAPPPLPPVAPPPALRADITVLGIDEQNRLASEAVISVREVIFRQHTPLLPALYFDRNSSDPPERYAFGGRDEAERFTLLSVAELGPLELSHHLPDLVGYRMREQPESRLTLYGMTSEDEPAALALERAERLRSYLIDVWNIPRSRIELKTGPGLLARSEETTEEGRSENRRVAFASDTPGLLAPLATERIIRDFNPPRIRLQPTIEAEAGIRRWRITLRQGDQQLTSFEGSGSEGISALRSDLSWRLSDNRIDSSAGRLVAELFVEDSSQQTTEASNHIELVVKRDSTVVEQGREVQGEVERLSYTLVAFGYRSADGDREHERRLVELAERIRDNARVEVTGYTDRIGDDRYNLELSRGRAEYVADRLRGLTSSRGVRNVEFMVRGAGSETGRFPNNLPEGRVLSRGASALVEQRQDQSDRP